MDPVTAGLNLATEILKFAVQVYNDTPQDQRIANAKAWAEFNHNILETLTSIQAKIKI